MPTKLLKILLPLLLLTGGAVVASAQSVRVTVRDASGETLPGAYVQVTGTRSGAVTDLDGLAMLDNVPNDATLKVTMFGYIDADIPVQGRKEIDVTLKDDVQSLDEVVVIGYGTAKRKDFVGSVSSVRVENSPIALMNNSNALETLKGNVAGLDIGAVNNAGGQPSMQMRGQRSISGSNAPLIVLDGMIYIGGINEINPSS